jgi:beta-galactosidase beta subunit
MTVRLQQDILFWQVNEDENPVTLTPGMFAIFSLKISIARAAHQPGDAPYHLRKAVIKIRP